MVVAAIPLHSAYILVNPKTVISPDSNTVVIVSSLVVYKTKFEPTKNTKGENRIWSDRYLYCRRFGRPIRPAEVAGEPTRIRPGGFSPSVVLVGSNAVISIGGELPVVTVLLAGLITGGGFGAGLAYKFKDVIELILIESISKQLGSELLVAGPELALRLQTFPPTLYEILQSCDEFVAFFWLDYCWVSRNFHSTIENVFVAKKSARSRTIQTTELEFSRLDHSSRAIYTYRKIDEGFQEENCIVQDQWRDDISYKTMPDFIKSNAECVRMRTRVPAQMGFARTCFMREGTCLVKITKGINKFHHMDNLVSLPLTQYCLLADIFEMGRQQKAQRNEYNIGLCARANNELMKGRMKWQDAS
ncbi:hypothetical protein EDD18DRAFT_1102056 [Armillaria luteobubalina]|uniref:Uncharacterized protein n=1 Tax=Armillaria luteobubalina TaxID=153913 RepID=A0AA39UWX0_9AGAR|nr:hypothetical protein EDD18DRAFT_1102056 [Armillaria luteobubalina]